MREPINKSALSLSLSLDQSSSGLEPLSARAVTAPGGMVRFMVMRDQTRAENERLRERLKDFEGALATRRLDPGELRSSPYWSRTDSSLCGPRFGRLKAAIEWTGGNVQPIKVRPIAASEEDSRTLEVVYGHLRSRACTDLNLPVLCTVEELDATAAFVQLHHENFDKQGLELHERGRSYRLALEAGLFPTVRHLAEALGSKKAPIVAAIAAYDSLGS